jgi:serine/threonine protein kinase
LSQPARYTEYSIPIGDDRYLAPELLCLNHENNGEILKKADIYALGLVFLQLALGSLFSPGYYSVETIDQRKQFKQRSLLLDQLEQSRLLTRLKSIIKRCLDPNPELRPDALWLFDSVKAVASKMLKENQGSEFANCKLQFKTFSSYGMPTKIKDVVQEALKKSIKQPFFKTIRNPTKINLN